MQDGPDPSGLPPVTAAQDDTQACHVGLRNMAALWASKRARDTPARPSATPSPGGGVGWGPAFEACRARRLGWPSRSVGDHENLLPQAVGTGHRTWLRSLLISGQA